MTEATQSTNNHLARNIGYGAGLIILILILMQFGRFVIPDFKLDNPPVTNTVAWDSAETGALWNTACADCHSNETVYPWYSYVAPVGWLVAHDTHEGREYLNVSTGHDIELDEMIEVIEEGEMPPAIYTVIHTDADLSTADREALIDGFQATFGNGSTTSAPATDHDDDDD